MDWNFIIFSVVKIAIVIGVVQGMVAYSVLAERKISAWIQTASGRTARRRRSSRTSRHRAVLDPARNFPAAGRRLEVHVQGRLHTGGRAKDLFLLAPAIAVIPAMLTVAVIPFGSNIGAERWSSRI